MSSKYLVAALGGGIDSSPSPIPPLQQEAERRGKHWLQRGIYEEGKKQKPPASLMICYYWKLPPPPWPNQNSFINQSVEFEGFLQSTRRLKKYHREAFFCFLPSWPSSKAKKGKTNPFCFVFEEVKFNCASTQHHQRTSRNQIKGSVVKRFTAGCLPLIPWPTN